MIAPLDAAACADELVALQRAAYRVEAVLLGTDDLPLLRETAAQLAASGETFLGAREADGRLVGALSYKELDGGVRDIHRLVVDPARFRRGIASALLAALGPGPALVATGAANAPARRLYERHGFAVVRERAAPSGVAIVEFERRVCT